jgi:hypothetical protein
MDITKLEAARRQIDTGVRLLLAHEDPVAIHSLAAAGFRILRDIGEHVGSPVDQLIKSGIKPGMDRQFWSAFNTLANFLKHADRDPVGEYKDFNEEANDGLLFFGAIYYQALGNELTIEMQSIVAYFSVRHPEFIRETADARLRQIVGVGEVFRRMSRGEHLVIAKQSLEAQLAAAGRRYGPA